MTPELLEDFGASATGRRGDPAGSKGYWGRMGWIGGLEGR